MKKLLLTLGAVAAVVAPVASVVACGSSTNEDGTEFKANTTSKADQAFSTAVKTFTDLHADAKIYVKGNIVTAKWSEEMAGGLGEASDDSTDTTDSKVKVSIVAKIDTSKGEITSITMNGVALEPIIAGDSINAMAAPELRILATAATTWATDKAAEAKITGTTTTQAKGASDVAIAYYAANDIWNNEPAADQTARDLEGYNNFLLYVHSAVVEDVDSTVIHNTNLKADQIKAINAATGFATSAKAMLDVASLKPATVLDEATKDILNNFAKEYPNVIKSAVILELLHVELSPASALSVGIVNLTLENAGLKHDFKIAKPTYAPDTFKNSEIAEFASKFALGIHGNIGDGTNEVPDSLKSIVTQDSTRGYIDDVTAIAALTEFAKTL